MKTKLFGFETVFAQAESLLAAGIPLDVVNLSSGEVAEPRRDEQTIHTLLQACDDSDLVIVLGGQDGVVALEVATDDSCSESLGRLMAKIELPVNTPIINPGDGYTYILYRFAGTPRKNKVELRSGLTLVANGEFIVVPPRDHGDPNKGWWKNFPTTMDDLAPIPEKLAALL